LRVSSSPDSEQAALNRRAAEDQNSKPDRDWQQACEGIAAVVDLSSALAPFRIDKSAQYAKLAGGCRLDLDPKAFQEGDAAATLIAQVQVILARLPDALLVLTPSTTARHFKEWLGAHAS
jgi:sarcosine oxidase gamma subunit